MNERIYRASLVLLVLAITSCSLEEKKDLESNSEIDKEQESTMSREERNQSIQLQEETRKVDAELEAYIDSL